MTEAHAVQAPHVAPLTLARMVGFVVLTHAAFGAVRLALALYALSHRASAFTVGVLVGLFALVPALLAVRAGRWLDTVDPIRPLLAGTALMFLGALLPAAFPYAVADLAPLVVGAVLIGTGFMFLQMTMQSVVGHATASGQRAAAFSWVALGFSTSGLVAPLAAGLSIDHLGHRWTFALAALALLAALAGLWGMRAALPRRPVAAPDRPPGRPFELLTHPRVRDVLVASALTAMAWDLQAFMMPVYGNAAGLSAAEIGLVLASFAAATFAIRLVMPRLARSFSEWQVIVFSLCTAAVAFALMPMVHAVVALMSIAFLLGLGLGASQPNVMSLLHAESPPGRVGEALGLRTTMMNTSQVALPLVFGAFGSVLGAGAVFGAMALLMGAGGWAAWQRHGRRG